MKIKGDAGGGFTEFAVISDDGSVAEVSPRALDCFCDARLGSRGSDSGWLSADFARAWSASRWSTAAEER
jgi:hypothetical protein